MTGMTYRVRDVLAAALLLALLSPVLLLTALAALLAQGRPLLFTQVRPGRYGRGFRMYKFRTMRPAGTGAGGTGDDAARLTRFGAVLRSTSLDELPSLWNVLRGDMSLVGPRPLLPDYLDQYSAEQHLRHLVRPGLTGLAQVSGRNGLDFPERLALDVAYVRGRSHLTDLRILLRTLVVVLRRDGISHPEHATMPQWTDPVVEPAETPRPTTQTAPPHLDKLDDRTASPHLG